MFDLHLHLDGSLSEQDFIYLAKKDGVDLGKDFPNSIYVPANCPSLEEYLTRFDLPLLLLQTKENIEYSFMSLTKRLNSLGYLYCEIRFAPLLHKQKDLSMKEIVAAALKGVEKGMQGSKIIVNLILCTMRHASFQENMETIEVANSFKGTRVVAVDLAGAEAMHPSSYYAEIFAKAREYELNITIHAGEATGSDEIMMALDNGAMRIGHGVHLSLDKDSVKRVLDNHICFEFCPTSNLQTKSLASYEDVPLRKFMELGIPVTINSDNMTVSNTTSILEMKRMIKTFNLSKKEVKGLLLNSIKYSFATEQDKEKIALDFEKSFDDYYLELVK